VLSVERRLTLYGRFMSGMTAIECLVWWFQTRIFSVVRAQVHLQHKNKGNQEQLVTLNIV